jgi:predicted nucleic-acid-binding Zn-ribbon protein
MEFLSFALLVLVYFIIETIYRDYFKYKKENLRAINQIEDFLEARRPQIKILAENLVRTFQCNLCNSNRLDTNVISFSGKEYSQISKKRPHKFLKISCTGCGITEFYNLNQLWGPDGLDPLPIDQPFYYQFIMMADNFHCPRCPHRKAVAKIITVRKKGVRHLLSPQPSEMVTLCCTNCGWSSFFDVELLHKEEKIHART